MNPIVIGASTEFASPEELLSELKRVSKARRTVLQAFNPDAVLSGRHILFSFFQAYKAFEEGRAISRSLANEWLLRAAATRSMEEAIRVLGVRGCGRVVLGIAGKNQRAKSILAELGAKPVPLPALTREKAANIERLFGVRATPFHSLEEMLSEKIALVELER